MQEALEILTKNVQAAASKQIQTASFQDPKLSPPEVQNDGDTKKTTPAVQAPKSSSSSTVTNETEIGASIDQKDPNLIQAVRNKYLIPPSSLPYNLEESELNPSMGQGQMMARLFQGVSCSFCGQKLHHPFCAQQFYSAFPKG